MNDKDVHCSIAEYRICWLVASNNRLWSIALQKDSNFPQSGQCVSGCNERYTLGERRLQRTPFCLECSVCCHTTMNFTSLQEQPRPLSSAAGKSATNSRLAVKNVVETEDLHTGIPHSRTLHPHMSCAIGYIDTRKVINSLTRQTKKV